MQLWEIAARLKLPVFPCNADKTPSCPHGFKDAARDPDAIKTLFASYPGELIGVPTGEVSGVDVLDLDTTRHKEAAAWKASINLPETRIHQTKSGGWHYIFRHHPGLRNWTSRPVAGVDGRADGGYIIFWPSFGYSVKQHAVAHWPETLLNLFKPKSQISNPTPIEPINDAKLMGIVRLIGNAMNGTRNDLLFWGACRVGEWINTGSLSRRVGEAVLMSAGQRAGLPDIEISKTIASAFNREAHSGDSA